MNTIKTLKAKGFCVKNAGHRYGNTCLLIQGLKGGITIDGDRRQLGRQLRHLARTL